MCSVWYLCQSIYSQFWIIIFNTCISSIHDVHKQSNLVILYVYAMNRIVFCRSKVHITHWSNFIFISSVFFVYHIGFFSSLANVSIYIALVAFRCSRFFASNFLASLFYKFPKLTFNLCFFVLLFRFYCTVSHWQTPCLFTVKLYDH